MRGKKASGLLPFPQQTGSSHALYAAPALEKGLDILELLSRTEEGLSRRDIADRLGRSVSEIFRMIECLVRRGYLLQTGDAFKLGNKLFGLAHEFPPMNRLLKQALPRMEALAKSVSQSCHLTVLSGAHQLCVAQVDPPGGVGFSVKIGAKIDIFRSASGRILVAFQNEAERRRLISLAESRLSLSERKAFSKSIVKVAQQGFAFTKSAQFSGVEAISYPILDLGGYAIAALTMPYVTRLDDATFPPASVARAALAQVASELNAALGGGIIGIAAKNRPTRRK